MEVKLLRITDDSEKLIARAYGICTGREAIPVKNIKKYVDIHPSPTEHASATFEISGISRACSHQLVRHRIASYSQESQRYVDMSDFEPVVPETARDKPMVEAIYRELLGHSAKAYAKLRSIGMTKEDARFVLPNATPTRIIVTMNFRSLLHFFRTRITKQAQWEIREMAKEMLGLVTPYAPAVFGGIDTSCN